jgi:Fe-S-cluster containining protein
MDICRVDGTSGGLMKFTREERFYTIPDDESRIILFGIINRYEEFIGEVERRMVVLRSFYGDDFTCHPTCDSCCLTDRTVSRLESYILGQGLETIDPSLLPRLAERTSRGFPSSGEECPLLIGSLCAVYHYRPLACRVKGLPLVSSTGDDYTLEVCPLNFQRSPEKLVLDLTHVVHIDRLAAELSGIDREFVTKALDEKWTPEMRVNLTAVIRDFLEDRKESRAARSQARESAQR